MTTRCFTRINPPSSPNDIARRVPIILRCRDETTARRESSNWPPSRSQSGDAGPREPQSRVCALTLRGRSPNVSQVPQQVDQHHFSDNWAEPAACPRELRFWVPASVGPGKDSLLCRSSVRPQASERPSCASVSPSAKRGSEHENCTNGGGVGVGRLKATRTLLITLAQQRAWRGNPLQIRRGGYYHPPDIPSFADHGVNYKRH